MALTSTLLLDLADSTQSITYTLSNNQVDQITFSSNSIAFSGISSFNLSKSDLLIYINSLNLFLTAITYNFPVLQNSKGLSLPLSLFEISLTSAGVEHIYYTQTSLGSVVYTMNYLPLTQSSSIASRSQITITLQEFILCCNLLTTYAQQVAIN